MRFHELRHACDNGGVDQWDEEISKVFDGVSDASLEKVASWLTDNMEVYPYTGTNSLGLRSSDRMVPADDWFGNDWKYRDRRVIHGLYLGMLHAMSCNMERGRVDPITSTGEYQFLALYPDLESYRSFYIPVRNVLDWMYEHKDELLGGVGK